MPNRKKTRSVNINLTTKDKKELEKLSNRYELSYSTIAWIITKNLTAWIHPDNYIYKDKDETKTSIKPRDYFTGKQLTNCIKLFVRRQLKKYIEDNLEGDKESKTKLFNLLQDHIYKEFETTIDKNWNRNKLYREITNFIKKNPDYAKRLMKIE